MSKNISVWMIIPQTNLHVGNESVVSFGVIDKAIQRDVTTKLPCINSSSLKGAIKEFLTAENITDQVIKDIFGSSKLDTKGDTQKGNAIFFDANLLFIPEQCSNGELYELVYSDEVLDKFVQRAKVLGAECTLDDLKNKVAKLAQHSKAEVDFKKLCDDDGLPIIARNKLNNGESVNLWYEQVLPSMSVLGTVIKTMNATDLDYLDEKIVQIGANATIGYGYCKFVKLNK